MATKTTVSIDLSPTQEIALLTRYGRKCSAETLVKRAIGEVLRQQEENIPVFVSRSAYEAKVKADLEVARQAELARIAQIPPAALELFERFRAGAKMHDEEGREISALELPDEGADAPEPLIAQFGGDNSEWYPIAPGEIRVDIPQSNPVNGESRESNA